jgi:hypothetical protein
MLAEQDRTRTSPQPRSSDEHYKRRQARAGDRHQQQCEPPIERHATGDRIVLQAAEANPSGQRIAGDELS